MPFRKRVPEYETLPFFTFLVVVFTMQPSRCDLLSLPLSSNPISEELLQQMCRFLWQVQRSSVPTVAEQIEARVPFLAKVRRQCGIVPSPPSSPPESKITSQQQPFPARVMYQSGAARLLQTKASAQRPAQHCDKNCAAGQCVACLRLRAFVNGCTEKSLSLSCAAYK